MRESSGVSLMELLISMTILAILGAIAAPTMSALRHDASRTAAVNSFFHALFLARSEAVKRGAVVSLCRSADRQTCADPTVPWTVGWIVFVNDDLEASPVRDPGEPLLAAHPGWAEGRITSNRTAYSFRPYQQGFANGTIVFCDPRGAAHARAIIISHTGRPRVAKLDADNKPLRCTAT